MSSQPHLDSKDLKLVRGSYEVVDGEHGFTEDANTSCEVDELRLPSHREMVSWSLLLMYVGSVTALTNRIE